MFLATRILVDERDIDFEILTLISQGGYSRLNINISSSLIYVKISFTFTKNCANIFCWIFLKSQHFNTLPLNIHPLYVKVIFDIFMIETRVSKIQKYSYHEDILTWNNFSHPGPYLFNHIRPLNIYIPICYVKNDIRMQHWLVPLLGQFLGSRRNLHFWSLQV